VTAASSHPQRGVILVSKNQKAEKIPFFFVDNLFFKMDIFPLFDFLRQDLRSTSPSFSASCAPDPGAHVYSKFSRVKLRSLFLGRKQNPF
jgi:hypothetical protein